jgi:hypothetical protein
MKALLPCFLILTLASCRGPHRSSAVSDEDAFTRVYARLVMLSADAEAGARSTPDQILAEEGMSRERFRTIVAELNRDPGKWGDLLGKVQTILEEETAGRVESRQSQTDSAGQALRPPTR